MVRSDLGAVSRKGGRSVVGGFPHPPLPFPSPPYAAGGEERPEVLLEAKSWQYRKGLGAVVGEEGDVPLGYELQTGPVHAPL